MHCTGSITPVKAISSLPSQIFVQSIYLLSLPLYEAALIFDRSQTPTRLFSNLTVSSRFHIAYSKSSPKYKSFPSLRTDSSRTRRAPPEVVVAPSPFHPFPSARVRPKNHKLAQEDIVRAGLVSDPPIYTNLHGPGACCDLGAGSSRSTFVDLGRPAVRPSLSNVGTTSCCYQPLYTCHRPAFSLNGLSRRNRLPNPCSFPEPLLPSLLPSNLQR